VVRIQHYRQPDGNHGRLLSNDRPANARAGSGRTQTSPEETVNHGANRIETIRRPADAGLVCVCEQDLDYGPILVLRCAICKMLLARLREIGKMMSFKFACNCRTAAGESATFNTFAEASVCL
jgi:hypothetical protein